MGKNVYHLKRFLELKPSFAPNGNELDTVQYCKSTRSRTRSSGKNQGKACNWQLCLKPMQLRSQEFEQTQACMITRLKLYGLLCPPPPSIRVLGQPRQPTSSSGNHMLHCFVSSHSTGTRLNWAYLGGAELAQLLPGVLHLRQQLCSHLSCFHADRPHLCLPLLPVFPLL